MSHKSISLVLTAVFSSMVLFNNAFAYGDGSSLQNPGNSCYQLLNSGINADGQYWIDPDGGSVSNAFQAYCDMTTNGGGWTLWASIATSSGPGDKLPSLTGLITPSSNGVMDGIRYQSLKLVSTEVRYKSSTANPWSNLVAYLVDTDAANLYGTKSSRPGMYIGSSESIFHQHWIFQGSNMSYFSIRRNSGESCYASGSNSFDYPIFRNGNANDGYILNQPLLCAPGALPFGAWMR